MWSGRPSDEPRGGIRKGRTYLEGQSGHHKGSCRVLRGQGQGKKTGLGIETQT
jgi:hypothetical protein